MSKITPEQLARLCARIDARIHAHGGSPIEVALRYSRNRLAQQFDAAPLPEIVALFYAELAAERELERRKRRDVTTAARRYPDAVGLLKRVQKRARATARRLSR